jgi:cyanophycinase
VTAARPDDRGTIALHGGGEFLPGDEAFLTAVLRAAPRAERETDVALRVVVVPTAASRGRPELAASNGVRAFERVAADAGIAVEVAPVPVTDATSAADASLAAQLAEADVIHLPGGDPDLIPSLYPGTAACTAILAALDRGAVLAGASAGAMALAELTWTPAGLVPGLGLVPGCLVMPHADAGSWARIVARNVALDIGDLGVLGLAERTGVLGRVAGAPWRVVGEGEARWLPPGVRDAGAALVAGDGGTLPVGRAG